MHAHAHMHAHTRTHTVTHAHTAMEDQLCTEGHSWSGIVRQACRSTSARIFHLGLWRAQAEMRWMAQPQLRTPWQHCLAPSSPSPCQTAPTKPAHPIRRSSALPSHMKTSCSSELRTTTYRPPSAHPSLMVHHKPRTPLGGALRVDAPTSRRGSGMWLYDLTRPPPPSLKVVCTNQPTIFSFRRPNPL